MTEAIVSSKPKVEVDERIERTLVARAIRRLAGDIAFSMPRSDREYVAQAERQFDAMQRELQEKRRDLARFVMESLAGKI